jgi:hypothetical protein
MLLLSDNAWEIQTTPRKGRGIFAKKAIRPGIVIGDYLGTVINNVTDDTREKDGLYLMYYHDRASIYPIDVQATGIHLLNHSCMPNCWFYAYRGHTLFFTLRTIFPGEELTADYLLSPVDYCQPCLHQCRCGTLLCRGTMHLPQEQFQKWNTFHESQGKETKRVPIRYGKLLKPLNDYPQPIPDHTIYNLFGTTKRAPEIKHAKKLPSITELRKTIRETGKMQAFPKLHVTVLGVLNNTVHTISLDAHI